MSAVAVIRKTYRDAFGRESVDTSTRFDEWGEAWEAFDAIEVAPSLLDRFDDYGRDVRLVRADLVDRWQERHGRFERA